MIYNARFIIVFMLLIITGLFINLHSDVEMPLNKPLSEFPAQIQNWHMLSQSTFSEDILKVLKTSEYINRQYINSEGNKVHLYIGYHGGGKDSGEIHSPKHCLPGSGWFKVMEKEILINVSGKQINLVKAIYQKGTTK
ncbi:MAG: exosortase C-terminal domain/associated protein EpsI, partial [Nitrospirota bacterium]